MKKIIFTFLLLFIFMTNTKALGPKFSLGEKVPNMVIVSHKGDEIHKGKIFVLTRNDGAFVYCLNPFKQSDKVNSYNEYDYNDPSFGISDEKLNKINIIAYYGYKYKNHDDLKWYGITQLLIWRSLDIDSYFVDDNGNRITDYDNDVIELQNLINNHDVYPSFFNQKLEFSINSSQSITDTNNALNKFEIKNTDMDAKINGNDLLLNMKEKGIYTIEFKRHNIKNETFRLYSSDGYQELIYPAFSPDLSFNMTIEVTSGSVTLNKIDSENKKRMEATLEGAIYGLYDDNNLITTIETNKNGVGFIDNLPFGKYYLKELNPSTGYQLDENLYEFEISRDNKEIYINSYESVIKGNIIINKYYGEEENYELEDGAIFEIYDIYNNLIGIYETINGMINVSLEYGSYYIKQIKGLHEYELVKDFIVDIKEEKDYVYNLYDKKKNNSIEDLILTNKDDTDYNLDDLIVEVPNTSKNDYNYLFYLLFVFVGSILIFISKMKKIDV